MDTTAKELFEDVKERLIEATENRNIANSERILSVAAGAFVLYTGIVGMFKRPLSSLAEVAVGGALILRGATGYCPVTDAMTHNEITIVEQIVDER